MKKNNYRPTLDDFAFEGRNKVYGAYFIRKTYQRRLFRSFIFSLLFFLIALYVFERAGRHRSDEYYYNSLSDLDVVGVNLSKNPYPSITIERTKGASASESLESPVIVADDEVAADQNQDQEPKAAGSDSTGLNGQGTEGKGTGDADDTGGGIVGEVYGSAELNPKFPGGDKAMQEFIRENLQYPEIARVQNITGAVHIYFVVKYDGSLGDVKVVKGLLPELDAEAVRVVKSMPLWKPGMRGGVPVNVRCIIPITVSPLKYK